jgi:thiamine-phosphate pyrophosphorylase
VKPPVGRLHVITDMTIQDRFSHIGLAMMAIAGGTDTIQFREKSMASRTVVETGELIRGLCREAGVTLIVNDRVDIAMALDADGVHLGQRDLPIPAARRLLGPSKLIGGTASTPEEARAAEAQGADYVGFGHVYATSSKRKRGEPKGPNAVRAVCEAVSIPVIAIGGIDASNLPPVIAAGAWGAAVIGAVCAARDPRAATAELVAVLRAAGESERG